jgi:hypothetical protein
MSPLAFGIGKARGAEFDPAIFYGNFVAFYWNFTNGKDLDIIASFLYPNLSGEVGARKGNEITNNDQTVTYMKWGGDNTESTSGYEAIYIDIPAIKTVPGFTGNEIELDLRCMWYGEVGTDPVVISTTGYEGGTMELEAATPGYPGLYGFLNPTATQSFVDFKSTKGRQITSTNREDSGQRVARVKINLNTYTLTFIEDN